MGTQGQPRHWPRLLHALAFCLVATGVVADYKPYTYASPSPPEYVTYPPYYYKSSPPPRLCLQISSTTSSQVLL
ncbi:hypothetical protein TIFTF001_037800 [Ficus carica]|uniref:Uncharacterized protein n=1 Tax=Ficus carica TaxID=3494 RepID=A0AA88E6W4_FICCA|nr:hypothetical protein TIFTF001_037761 [Ficus carica]GMN68708.1 hypothetical protein TIFTF001_037766 [Ficus carica]GMN68742.1 hypothetical protein TIFTF001_037796 [Ficus carica]GMN68745.1 hypothetical protein TIFTF001_037800 [Ficus carica]